MSDFLTDDAQPKFQKGRAKPQELKPWQERSPKGEVVRKVRCWDGFLGCEEWLSASTFRHHPHLCDRCVAALCARYSVPQKDVDFLAILLAQDHSLITSCLYLKAEQVKVDVLAQGKEERIRSLYSDVMKAGKDQRAVAGVIKAYRAWMYEQAGVVLKPAKHAPGFSTLSEAA